MTKRPKIGFVLPNRGPIIYPESITPRSLIELAVEAERLGFDSVWVGDSILAKPRLDSITLLASVASVTSSVKLGVACMASMPLRNPIQLAHAWSTLDVLSSGRTILVACMGGGEEFFKREYEVFGIPHKERARILEESIELIKRLWSEETVTFQGRYFSLRNVVLQPKPVQKPHPPIWIVSNLANPNRYRAPLHVVERAYRRVARLGDGWMTTMCTPAQFKEAWNTIREFVAEYGKDPNSFETALYYNININEDEERALRESKEFLDKYYSTSFGLETVRLWVAAGRLSKCVEMISAYHRAGARVITLRITSRDQLGQLRVIARDLLPSL